MHNPEILEELKSQIEAYEKEVQNLIEGLKGLKLMLMELGDQIEAQALEIFKDGSYEEETDRP